MNNLRDLHITFDRVLGVTLIAQAAGRFNKVIIVPINALITEMEKKNPIKSPGNGNKVLDSKYDQMDLTKNTRQ